MRSGAVWAAGLALAVLLISLPLLALQAPVVTRALSARYSLTEQAGIASERSLQLAEEVRAFVVGGDGVLPVEVDGMAGFDASAVSHLADVRDVLRASRAVTFTVGFGLAALLVWAIARKRRGEIGRALLIGGTVTIGTVGLFAVVATTDFYTFFSAFHGVFFTDGTWTFPYDSLLIRLFPEPFWMVAGMLWAALSVALGAIAVIAGFIVRRNVRREGA